MKSAILSTALGTLVLAMILAASAAAQQNTSDVQGKRRARIATCR